MCSSQQHPSFQQTPTRIATVPQGIQYSFHHLVQDWLMIIFQGLSFFWHGSFLSLQSFGGIFRLFVKMSYQKELFCIFEYSERVFTNHTKFRELHLSVIQNCQNVHVFLKGIFSVKQGNDKGVKCAKRPYDTGQSGVGVRPMGIGPCTGHCCGQAQASGARGLRVACKG